MDLEKVFRELNSGDTNLFVFGFLFEEVYMETNLLRIYLSMRYL